MSASSKKKLRNEQEAAKLTERQLAEQKEAKKLKLYTAAFAVVLVLLLITAVTVGVLQTISNSGIREKNTVAMTIDGKEISNAELNYYYMSTVNTFYSQNGSYAAMFGLDVTKPLNEQVMDESTGETWADYFLESAKTAATSVYALKEAAVAAGHTLNEDLTSAANSTVENLELYAAIYGYADAESYLKAMYGKGATMETYRSYIEDTLLADDYQAAYGESLTYTDADLREAEKDNFHAYSAYTYNYYHLPVNKFLEGGTTAEDGTVTYSDEENAAAVAACEATAKALTGEDITSVELLDAAIAKLPINADATATTASSFYENNPYNYISAPVAEWISDSSRKEGDLAYIANSTKDSDGNETINGYYVVYFHSSNDNKFALKDVRHILVNFAGGTTDETTGAVTYSDEEKAAAKAEAEEILAAFKAGEATEASFAALAAEKTDDTGSAANGGLYENVYPGQMVANFEDWCYDAHKTGDTGIVETEYGYHVMYFVGDSDLTYRDYQITNELRSADVSEWYSALVSGVATTEGDTSYIAKDLVLSAGAG